jgi:hypothetical protein
MRETRHLFCAPCGRQPHWSRALAAHRLERIASSASVSATSVLVVALILCGIDAD